MKLGEEFNPSNPSERTKNMAFSPGNLNIWVGPRAIHAFIQTATYPPFTKGTTRIKLYVLGDPVYPFVTNVYLCASKKTQVHAGGQRVAGPLTPTEVVHHWEDHLPSKAAIVADSFFGGHGTARQLVLFDHPFLLLFERDEEGVAEAGGLLNQGRRLRRFARAGAAT